MKKRGQITIFIIVGLILIAVAVFAYIFYNVADERLNYSPNDPISYGKINPVKEQMSLCLEGKLKKGITLFGLSKPDLDKYINQNVEDCIKFSSFESQGYIFDRKNLPIIESTTSEDTAYLDVEPRIIVTFATNKSVIPAFTVKVSLNPEEDVSIDANGIVQKATYINSSDDNAQLLIPKGTKISGSSDTLNVVIKNNEQISYQYFLFPIVYDFGPDGTTFDPPVPLTISYDPTLLLPGQSEDDLKISYYDTTTGSWIDLDTTVDKTNHILKASLSHFTEVGVRTSTDTPPSKDFKVFITNPTNAFFTVFIDGNTIYTGTYRTADSADDYFSQSTSFDSISGGKKSDCSFFNSEAFFRIRKFKENIYAGVERNNYHGNGEGPRDTGAIWKLENGVWKFKHAINGDLGCYDLVATKTKLYAACGKTLVVTSDGSTFQNIPIPDGGSVWRMAELNGGIYMGGNTKACDWGCGGKGVLLIYNASKVVVSSDSTKSFDISIGGSTGLSSPYNVSAVNITLPTSFLFISATNRTNLGSSNFTRGGNVLSWKKIINFTNYTHGINFSFNASTSTPGTYNLSIILYNASNSAIVNSTNVTVIVGDTAKDTSIGDTSQNSWAGDTFTKKVPPANDLTDWALHGITAFKGKIYVGTVSNQGKSYIYSYDPKTDLFKQVHKIERGGAIHWMGNDGSYIYAGISSDDAIAYLFRSIDGTTWEKIGDLPGGFVIDGMNSSRGHMYIAGGKWKGEGTIWWNGPTVGGDGACYSEEEEGSINTEFMNNATCLANPEGFYLDYNNDVATSKFTEKPHGALLHWCQFGRVEKGTRRYNCFKEVDCGSGPLSECSKDPEKWYLGLYPDVKDSAYGTMDKGGRKHWDEHGKSEKRLNCFDSNFLVNTAGTQFLNDPECTKDPRAFYLKYNPDVKASDMDALTHWCQFGRFEGSSNPNRAYHCFEESECGGKRSDCDKDPEAWYMALYPEIRANPSFSGNQGGLLHWCQSGMKEGRQSCFSTSICTSCPTKLPLDCGDGNMHPWPSTPQPPLCKQECLPGI